MDRKGIFGDWRQMPVYQVLNHLPELGDNLAALDRPPASQPVFERGIGVRLCQFDRLDVLAEGDLAAVGKGDDRIIDLPSRLG